MAIDRSDDSDERRVRIDAMIVFGADARKRSRMWSKGTRGDMSWSWRHIRRCAGPDDRRTIRSL